MMKIINAASFFCLLASGVSAFTQQNSASPRRPTFLGVSDIAAVGAKIPSVADDQKTLRVLALHGKEETGDAFRSTMNNWRDEILLDHDVRMEINTLEGPFDEGKGKAWWTTAEGVRSFEADDYEGFEESKQIVLDALNSADEPYDLVVGHSQGAMLAASLLAVADLKHPKVGYVLNGLGWPNPFSEEFKSLEFSGEKPNILLVTGMRDKVNPPEHAEEMKETFRKAGADVSSIKHPTGHSVPIKRDETIKLIMNWIMDKSD